MFLQFYSEELGLYETEIESQDDYEDNITSNVHKLIGKDSLFHYGPKDIHVSSSLCGESFNIDIEPTRVNDPTWNILASQQFVSNSTMDLLVERTHLQSSFLTTSVRLFLSTL